MSTAVDLRQHMLCMDCVVLFISALILLSLHQLSAKTSSTTALFWSSFSFNKFIFTYLCLHMTRGRWSVTLFKHKKKKVIISVLFSVFTSWDECGQISLSWILFCWAQRQMLPTRGQLCSASLRFLAWTYVGCRGLRLSQAIAFCAADWCEWTGLMWLVCKNGVRFAHACGICVRMGGVRRGRKEGGCCLNICRHTEELRVPSSHTYDRVRGHVDALLQTESREEKTDDRRHNSDVTTKLKWADAGEENAWEWGKEGKGKEMGWRRGWMRG